LYLYSYLGDNQVESISIILLYAFFRQTSFTFSCFTIVWLSSRRVPTTLACDPISITSTTPGPTKIRTCMRTETTPLASCIRDHRQTVAAARPSGGKYLSWLDFIGTCINNSDSMYRIIMFQNSMYRNSVVLPLRIEYYQNSTLYIKPTILTDYFQSK